MKLALHHGQKILATNSVMHNLGQDEFAQVKLDKLSILHNTTLALLQYAQALVYLYKRN